MNKWMSDDERDARESAYQEWLEQIKKEDKADMEPTPSGINPPTWEEIARMKEENRINTPNREIGFCEFCGDVPTCCVCGRGID